MLTSKRGVRGWPKRVEDCLVADLAASAACQSVGCRIEHTADERPIKNGLTTRHKPRLDQRRSVQRSRSATDRGRETESDGSQKLAWTGFDWERIQDVPNSLKADGHVVAMIAVTENHVQSDQIVAIAFHCPSAAIEIRAYLGAIDLTQRVSRRMRAEWQDGASVATLSSNGNCVMMVSFGMLMIPCWLLDESGFTMGTTSGRKGGTIW